MTDLQERFSSKTRAVCVTHYFGFPQPVAKIRKLCDEKQIHMIEDCALSLFSSDGTSRLGSVADVSVFSFPKTLPVPDGGMMVINNSDLKIDRDDLRKPSLLEVLRKELPLLKRYILCMSSSSNVLYPLLWSLLKTKRSTSAANNCRTVYPDMPLNYYYNENISDTRISRIAKHMLEKFSVCEIIEKRRKNFSFYSNLLSGVEGIEFLFKDLPDGVCPLYFPVIVRNREQVCQKLNELSISAIAWWAGYHRGLPWNEYPDACFLKDNLLVLPVHPQLFEHHIESISQRLISFVREVGA